MRGYYERVEKLLSITLHIQCYGHQLLVSLFIQLERSYGIKGWLGEIVILASYKFTLKDYMKFWV